MTAGGRGEVEGVLLAEGDGATGDTAILRGKGRGVTGIQVLQKPISSGVSVSSAGSLTWIRGLGSGQWSRSRVADIHALEQSANPGHSI